MSLSFSSNILLLIAAALVGTIILIALLRHLHLPPVSIWLITASLLLTTLAAGGLVWNIPATGPVAVLVDLSPSTRTAAYRNRAYLQQRLDQLLGQRRYRIVYFPDDGPISGISPNKRSSDDTIDASHSPDLRDLPADQTHLPEPADASAIVLFSDGHFEPPPVLPPVFAVLDPQLQNVDDARVVQLTWQGDRAAAQVGLSQPRTLTWTNILGPAVKQLQSGQHLLVVSPDDSAAPISARLAGGDFWPENDHLTLAPQPQSHTAYWWIGARSAPAGWNHLTVEQIPTARTTWLNVSAIVLDNISAHRLSPAQQQRLMQYVADLGGTLIILGGDSAFGADGYTGTVLDDLSPLTASPPTPVRHWILLTDASGSMASPAGPVSRFDTAVSAISSTLAHLPDNDRVSIGAFAADVQWWIEGERVEAAQHRPLPPVAVQPRGPTNLQAALDAISKQSDQLPVELIILTDGQARLDDIAPLADHLRSARVRLWLLAISDGPAIDHLTKLASQTNGGLLSQSDPTVWSAQLQQLAHRAGSSPMIHWPISPQQLSDLPVSEDVVENWNRTWLRDGAQLLAQANWNDQTIPLLARWQRGTGTVLAAAWSAFLPDVEQWAQRTASLPHDPRFSVHLQSADKLRVTVDAVSVGSSKNNGANTHLNDQIFTLRLFESAQLHQYPVPQIAPGRYEIVLPAPATPTSLTISQDDRIIDRLAIAGRYPTEFDALGTDKMALHKLTKATGGQLISARQTSPLDLPHRHRPIQLSGYLLVGAFFFMATALFCLRRS